MTEPTSAPAETSYRLPAEFEPHEATWLGWPHNRADWPGKFGPIPWVFTEIVRWLSRSERVEIVAADEDAQARAESRLTRASANLENVRFHQFPTDRGWLRDSGPFWTFPTAAPDSRPRLLDFKFNAWAKYDNWKHDNRLPRRIARQLGLDRVKPRVDIDGQPTRVVLEGGSIDVNGKGTLLTTEECLLSHDQERNPGLDRAGYECLFLDYFGVTNVIWLGHGIVGDDTHGHVDDLARFVGPRTVVTVVDRDSSSPNHRPLIDNLERLQSARDENGQPLDIIELPMPRPLVFDDLILPASYANFLIANTVVLVPTFNDPADREALGLLASVFPDRQVVGIHAVDLVWGFGTIHCLTRDQPAAPAT